MSTPVSFTVRPPGGSSSRQSRPNASGWNAPSQNRFQDEDSDDEHGHVFGQRQAQRRQRDARTQDTEIHGFGNGKALSRHKSPEPLIIAPQPNKDWHEAARAAGRRAPSYRPEAQLKADPTDSVERINDEPQRSGLRRVDPSLSLVKEEPAERHPPAPETKDDIKPDVKPDISTLDTKPSLDEQALAAVLAGDVSAPEDKPTHPDLVIASSGPDRHWSETDALQRDLVALPTESTLDDYAAVPVEAFGAAILRGMGYNPANETEIHIPKARPALLGLGAKALSTDVPPSRSAAAKSKRRKEEYATRGGRGFNAAQLLVRRGGDTDREGSASGTATPAGSSPRSDDRRRRREDDDEGRDAKRRERDGDRDRRDRDTDRDRRDGDRDRRDRRDRDRDRGGDRDRYETEEERARRKAKERARADRDRAERDGRDRDGDRRRDERDRDRDRDRERDRDRRGTERRDYGRDRERERDRDRDRDRYRDDRNGRDSGRDQERNKDRN